MVFQDPFGSLNPRMTVDDIVGEGLAIMGRAARDERVAELLEIVGLPASSTRRATPTSSQAGRGSASELPAPLPYNPSFLVCDEPVSALDVSIQAQIINLLEDLQERFSLSYLFVAHDLSVVRHIADRIAVMYIGKIMEEAPTEELFEHPMHPYTHALFSSIPSLDPEKRHGLKAITGEPTSPVNPPPGCRFASRCPHVMEACREGEIQVVEKAPGHKVRCIL